MVLIGVLQNEDHAIIRFRPLAGIMVLIKDRQKGIKVRVVQSFRPLAGIMVLIIMDEMDD